MSGFFYHPRHAGADLGSSSRLVAPREGEWRNLHVRIGSARASGGGHLVPVLAQQTDLFQVTCHGGAGGHGGRADAEAGVGWRVPQTLKQCQGLEGMNGETDEDRIERVRNG